jgi:hypothetical protein
MADTFWNLLSHAQQSAPALLGCLGYGQPTQRHSYCRLAGCFVHQLIVAVLTATGRAIMAKRNVVISAHNRVPIAIRLRAPPPPRRFRQACAWK